MKETKTPFVAKTTPKDYDFTEIKNVFDDFDFKVKTTKNRLTIEFDDENHISSFFNLISK